MVQKVLVRTEVHNGVLEVTLTRAEKRNALSAAMFAALGEAFARAAEDKEVTRVLVRGEGPVFCAGIDLDSLAAGLSDNDARGVEEGGAELQRPFMALERAGRPGGPGGRGGGGGTDPAG